MRRGRGRAAAWIAAVVGPSMVGGQSRPSSRPVVAPHRPFPLTRCAPAPLPQLVEELLTFWSLEDYETTLEELEEVLIVSARRFGGRAWSSRAGARQRLAGAVARGTHVVRTQPRLAGPKFDAAAPAPRVSPRCHTAQTADFGPKTALKIVDGLRDQLKAGTCAPGRRPCGRCPACPHRPAAAHPALRAKPMLAWPRPHPDPGPHIPAAPAAPPARPAQH
jgi:hypothetical protein